MTAFIVEVVARAIRAATDKSLSCANQSLIAHYLRGGCIVAVYYGYAMDLSHGAEQ
ncbi:MAG: hypothetical protein ACJA0N_002256 [Pseudohongiellaceae bacterium]|jgi:hypothetical protein